ncbi:MAG: hypothetical protein QOF49_550, partial [Chloroflexota bacterium]|nr:hypothetical protein [Chloroflexota bacterium]
PPPCAISRGNYDLAAVSSTEIVDPLAAFFRYHSSQVSPNGANDGAVTDPSIDAALETVQTTADFGVMRGAMADFQRLYGEQVVEMPLYSRTVVELHVPKLGNFAANAFHGGVTWNVADWFLSR